MRDRRPALALLFALVSFASATSFDDLVPVDPSLGCTRYVTANASGLTHLPCGSTEEEACFGLSPETSFFGLARSDVVCLLSGLYHFDPASQPLVVPIGASIYAISPVVITQSPGLVTGAVFSLERSDDPQDPPLQSTISGLTFNGFNLNATGRIFDLDSDFPVLETKPAVVFESLLFDSQAQTTVIELHDAQVYFTDCGFFQTAGKTTNDSYSDEEPLAWVQLHSCTTVMASIDVKAMFGGVHAVAAWEGELQVSTSHFATAHAFYTQETEIDIIDSEFQGATAIFAEKGPLTVTNCTFAHVKSNNSPLIKLAGSGTGVTITYTDFFMVGSADEADPQTAIFVDHIDNVTVNFCSFLPSPTIAPTAGMMSIYSEEYAYVDATNNWFGDALGPRSCCTASLNTITIWPGADFSNWSTTADLTSFDESDVEATCAELHCDYMPAYGYAVFGVAVSVLLAASILAAGFRDKLFGVTDMHEEEAEEDDDYDIDEAEDPAAETEALLPTAGGKAGRSPHRTPPVSAGAINPTAGSKIAEEHVSPISVTELTNWPTDSLLIKLRIYTLAGLLMAGIAASVAAFFISHVWWEELERSIVKPSSLNLVTLILNVINVAILFFTLIALLLLKRFKNGRFVLALTTALQSVFFPFYVLIVITTLVSYQQALPLIASDQLVNFITAAVCGTCQMPIIFYAWRAFNWMEAPYLEDLHFQIAESNNIHTVKSLLRSPELTRRSIAIIVTTIIFLLVSLVPLVLFYVLYEGHVPIKEAPILIAVVGIIYSIFSVLYAIMYFRTTMGLVVWIMAVITMFLILGGSIVWFAFFFQGSELDAGNVIEESLFLTAPSVACILLLVVLLRLVWSLRTQVIETLPAIILANIQQARAEEKKQP